MSDPIDPAVSPADRDAPFPFVSRVDATAYIGDMAGSLKRIALRSDLAELARKLEQVELHARGILQGREPQGAVSGRQVR